MEETATAAPAEKASSYRYWVRESPGTPRRCLSPASSTPLPTAAATGTHRPSALSGIRLEPGRKRTSTHGPMDLLGSFSMEFPTGKASIYEVSKCSGDISIMLDKTVQFHKSAFQVTVRNKKRVGYNYELSLKFQGEWLIEEENKFRGHLDIPEFSFGEIDDLEIQVRFSDDKGLGSDNKTRLCKDLKSFLSPIQEKLCMFEEELKGR